MRDGKNKNLPFWWQQAVAAAHGLQLVVLNIDRANTVMEASEALLDKLRITENSTNVALLT